MLPLDAVIICICDKTGAVSSFASPRLGQELSGDLNPWRPDAKELIILGGFLVNVSVKSEDLL